MIGTRVKPEIGTFTVAMPWYERADFAKLWELAHDRDEMPADYDVWHHNAQQAFKLNVAAGRAIQIVTIRPKPFLAWLAERPNTAAERLRYVELSAANLVASSALPTSIELPNQDAHGNQHRE